MNAGAIGAHFTSRDLHDVAVPLRWRRLATALSNRVVVFCRKDLDSCSCFMFYKVILLLSLGEQEVRQCKYKEVVCRHLVRASYQRAHGG